MYTYFEYNIIIIIELSTHIIIRDCIIRLILYNILCYIKKNK